MHIKRNNCVLALLMLITASVFVLAQDGPKTTTLEDLKNSPQPAAPTSAEVMRSRISNAKASLVVKNYRAAIYELENIKRETNDPTVHRVLNVLLMHAYLEQGEYAKAKDFLKSLAQNKNEPADYFVVAGQVISGARSQLARYHALGVSISDSTLPEEAKKDLDEMRETLELVIAQSRELGVKKDQQSTAATVVEESSAARSKLARDSYDEKRWLDQVAEAREQIIKPRSKIIDAVSMPDPEPELTLVAKTIETKPTETGLTEEVAKTPEEKPVPAETTVAANEGPVLRPVADTKPIETNTPAKNNPEPPKTQPERIVPTDRKVRIIEGAETETASKPKTDEKQPNVKSTDQVASNQKQAEPAKPVPSENDEETVNGPLSMGSLIAYATKTVSPVYPSQAKTMRMTGMVTVEVEVDEDGRVSKVQNASGPALLKRAAQDAVRKWQFTPFEIDGRPVKATGFINFNFDL